MIRTASILAVAATTALLSAGPAAAAPANVLMDGMAGDSIFLNATFTVTDFGVGQAGQLVANGPLHGTITGPPGTTQKTVDQRVSLPVDRGASTSSCYRMDLRIGPADENLAGFPIHLDRADFHVEITDGPGSRLRLPLCEFTDVLPDDAADSARIAAPLNHIVGLIGQR